MARRKDHTREELIEMAIEAGKEIVVAEGPFALTARKVAAKIGYTPGTLYNLFENLDGLVLAINTENLQVFGGELQRVVESKETPDECLRAMSEAYLKFQERSPHLWSLLFAVPIMYTSDEYSVAVKRVFGLVTHVMSGLGVDEILARRNGKVFWSALHGICLLRESGKLDVAEPDPASDLVDCLLQKFVMNK